MNNADLQSSRERSEDVNSLASAQMFLSSVHRDLSSVGKVSLVDILERVESCYDEYPELETECPRKNVVTEILSTIDGVPDKAAVPLLMFCVALDASSMLAVKSLLERMARLEWVEAIVEIVPLLAGNRELTWDAIVPTLRELRRKGQLKEASSLLGEAMGAISPPPRRSVDESDLKGTFVELGKMVGDLALKGNGQAEDRKHDPSTLFKSAWSARRRLRISAPVAEDSFCDIQLLRMAKRVSAKLSSPPRSSPLQLQPRMAWPSGQITYHAFLKQWSTELHEQANWLPTLSMDEWLSFNYQQVNWLPAMKIGNAGERVDRMVRSKPGQIGQIVFGPYVRLLPGEYHARICMDVWGWPLVWKYRRPAIATLDAVGNSGRIIVARRRVWLWNCFCSIFDLFFVVTEDQNSSPYGLRVWTHGVAPLRISSIVVSRV